MVLITTINAWKIQVFIYPIIRELEISPICLKEEQGSVFALYPYMN